MSETIEQLRRKMEAAAAAEDFEEASRLRDRISILRGQASDADPDIDIAGLVRQRSGKMGLGSSRQPVTPPEGWKPPRKPDPMTRGRGRGNRR